MRPSIMTSHRPFVCDACSQTFTRNENLERHRRSRHGGHTHRPFQCVRCQARFSRRDVCKRHRERCRGGSGRRPASCDDGGDGQGRHLDPAFPEETASPPTPPTTSFSPDIILGSPILDRAEGQPPSPLENWTRPSLSESSSRRTACPDATRGGTDAHIAAYFEYFHPSFPLLHRPTFSQETPEVLKNIIIAIGSLYTAHTMSGPDAKSCLQRTQSQWETGCEELARLVGSDWRELRRTWVIQAWLLHIIYGAFMGDAAQYNEAKKMLRSLVDAAQDLGLLRQAIATSASQSWVTAYELLSAGADAQTLHDQWMLYVEEESMKLSMYTLLFLDFHIFYPCNIRSLTSPIDLDWELPFPISLWESDTAVAWLERLGEEPRVHALLNPDEELGLPRLTTSSLTLAMQSLMSDSPSPYLIAALAASPIATLFLLTNIDAFVRDFTRCYYQLPPGLADPSTFHIFTQSQNRQISTALRHISRTVIGRDLTRDASDRPIWTAIERMALAIKISLYKPDDLLIGGIVDSSAVAGLATATHLTLGRYAGARRSLQSLLQHNSGDDAVLMILDEAMCALSSIYCSDHQDAVRETPWTIVASYRILLAIWRSLRWAAAEIRGRAGSQAQIHRRFEASTVIFHAIMEVVREQEGLAGQHASHSAIESDHAMMGTSPDVSETCFTKAVLKFWKERSVWAIGTSMTTVLEEIVSAGF